MWTFKGYYTLVSLVTVFLKSILIFNSHLSDKLDKVKCLKEVVKKLPFCEHSASMACHQDPKIYRCMALCAKALDCCSKLCKARCSDCQLLSKDSQATSVKRTVHKPHPCERTLYCQHQCKLDCHPKEKGCNSNCQELCQHQCTHRRCKDPCSTPCTPCMEQCTWQCQHFACPVSCGSVSFLFNI